MKRWWHAVGVALLALLAGGAGPCPMEVSSPTNTTGDDAGTATSQLDIGGTQGAVWTASLDNTVHVTLRGELETYEADVAIGATTVGLGPWLIDLGLLCARPDIVCPSMVLGSSFTLVQPVSGAEAVQLYFDESSALRSSFGVQGLQGQLQQSALTVSLSQEAQDGVPDCALLSASMIDVAAVEVDQAANADADASVQTAGVATTLRGRVTVSYGATCLALVGAASLQPGDVVELSIGFSAQRRM